MHDAWGVLSSSKCFGFTNTYVLLSKSRTHSTWVAEKPFVRHHPVTLTCDNEFVEWSTLFEFCTVRVQNSNLQCVVSDRYWTQSDWKDAQTIDYEHIILRTFNYRIFAVFFGKYHSEPPLRFIFSHGTVWWRPQPSWVIIAWLSMCYLLWNEIMSNTVRGLSKLMSGGHCFKGRVKGLLKIAWTLITHRSCARKCQNGISCVTGKKSG